MFRSLVIAPFVSLEYCFTYILGLWKSFNGRSLELGLEQVAASQSAKRVAHQRNQLQQVDDA